MMNDLMLINIKYFFLFVCLLIIIPEAANSQSIWNEELSYNNQLNKLYKTQQFYDSLSTVYKNETEKISRLKESGSDNPEKLMAQAVVISNKLDKVNNELTNLKKQLENKRKKLYKLYSNRIDSLRIIERSKTTTVEKDNINIEILSLFQKRFSMSNDAGILTYIPEQLASINLNKAKDSIERTLYTEYLNNAIGEASRQISNTSESIVKIEEMISLQEKLDEFIEDVEFNNNSNRFRSSRNSQIAAAEPARDLNSEVGFDYGSQVKNSVQIINQLSLFASAVSSNRQIDLTDNEIKNMSLNDYLELLKELKMRLQNYKAVLQKNLKN